jgi:hypothetical protein
MSCCSSAVVVEKEAKRKNYKLIFSFDLKGQSTSVIEMLRCKRDVEKW